MDAINTVEPVHIIEMVYLALLVIVGVITYGKIRDDKRAAERGEWRTSECTLHAWEFFGGWLGSFLSQQNFRHKTKKTSYQFQFWTIVIIHICGICYVVTHRDEINDATNNNGNNVTNNFTDNPSFEISTN